MAVQFPFVTADYLLRIILSIWPSMQGGMGAIPITWQEIQAYVDLTGISLNAWEAKTIKDCSLVFVSQSQLSAKTDCPSPIMEEKDPLQLKRQIKDLLRS
jgi:hypothetical protein